MATGKVRCAAEPDNADLEDSLMKNLTSDEFRRRWEAQVIPLDPSPRIWRVMDGGREIGLDMQVWRHSFLSGALLAGFVREP